MRTLAILLCVPAFIFATSFYEENEEVTWETEEHMTGDINAFQRRPQPRPRPQVTAPTIVNPVRWIDNNQDLQALLQDTASHPSITTLVIESITTTEFTIPNTFTNLKHVTLRKCPRIQRLTSPNIDILLVVECPRLRDCNVDSIGHLTKVRCPLLGD